MKAETLVASVCPYRDEQELTASRGVKETREIGSWVEADCVMNRIGLFHTGYDVARCVVAAPIDFHRDATHDASSVKQASMVNRRSEPASLTCRSSESCVSWSFRVGTSFKDFFLRSVCNPRRRKKLTISDENQESQAMETSVEGKDPRRKLGDRFRHFV